MARVIIARGEDPALLILEHAQECPELASLLQLGITP